MPSVHLVHGFHARRLDSVVPLFRGSHRDGLSASAQAVPRLVQEVLDSHANGAAVFDIRLCVQDVRVQWASKR